MLPLTAEDLDTSRSTLPSILDRATAFLMRESKTDRIKRNHEETKCLSVKAPVSECYQADEFETLEHCCQGQLILKQNSNLIIDYAETTCMRSRSRPQMLPDASPRRSAAPMKDRAEGFKWAASRS